VDKAEIYLIDECGHLPMIERIAEFNAQILAFLTGDARYLDQISPAPAPGEGAEAPHAEEVDEARPSTEPSGPADDTVDLSPRPAASGHDNVPRVVRKHGGRYPARTSPPNSHADAVEQPPASAGRTRRETSDQDFLPELPDDLFDWPETRREFGSRVRPEDDPSDDKS
jgi:hypothetical protein